MKHKILLVLLLSSMACITATAQKVSMDFRQVKLAKVFDAITQQTGLTVAYSRPTVNPDKLVTVRADEEELAHVLDRLLAGMGVTYEISGKKVYLKAKAASEATHQKREGEKDFRRNRRRERRARNRCEHCRKRNFFGNDYKC